MDQATFDLLFSPVLDRLMFLTKKKPDSRDPSLLCKLAEEVSPNIAPNSSMGDRSDFLSFTKSRIHFFSGDSPDPLTANLYAVAQSGDFSFLATRTESIVQKHHLLFSHPKTELILKGDLSSIDKKIIRAVEIVNELDMKTGIPEGLRSNTLVNYFYWAPFISGFPSRYTNYRVKGFFIQNFVDSISSSPSKSITNISEKELISLEDLFFKKFAQSVFFYTSTRIRENGEIPKLPKRLELLGRSGLLKSIFKKYTYDEAQFSMTIDILFESLLNEFPKWVNERIGEDPTLHAYFAKLETRLNSKKNDKHTAMMEVGSSTTVSPLNGPIYPIFRQTMNELLEALS